MGVVVLGEEGGKTELRKEAGLGEARDSLEDITKQEGFAEGVTEERKETKFSGGWGGRWTTHLFVPIQGRKE
jgi:hypothetical protein